MNWEDDQQLLVYMKRITIALEDLSQKGIVAFPPANRRMNP